MHISLTTHTAPVDVWMEGGRNILKGFTTRKTNAYAAIIDGATAYENLNKFVDLRRRAILSCFCGNDYMDHLYKFSVGTKPNTHGLTHKVMKKYAVLKSDSARDGFLSKLERNRRCLTLSYPNTNPI